MAACSNNESALPAAPPPPASGLARLERHAFPSWFLSMDEPLTHRLKRIIVETLKLEGVQPEEIDENEPLVGSGLALDSLDVLELVMRIEKEYGIKIKSSEESRKALASVSSLAAFIQMRSGAGASASSNTGG
ncbi:MAG: phosphopantetheine-binding protein [Opitutaceae bacterium]